MNWIWAALMPHPPALLPQVGRGREKAAVHTQTGSRRLLAKIAACQAEGRPDFLLILSPHQPREAGALLVNSAPALSGSLKFYGFPNIRCRLTTDMEIKDALVASLSRAGLPVLEKASPDISSDHGTIVPLHILRRLWPEQPPAIIANPVGLSPAQALELGRTLAALDWPGRHGALLASGDFSHRLAHGSPAGYHPAGAEFDHDLAEVLAKGEAESLIAKWSPERLAEAGECGLRSALALSGLAGGPAEVLSYEAPFGVGYCHAFWRPR